MVTLGNWRERMSEDMRLCDFRPRTQEGYLLAVRLFLERLGREPESLTDEDVRAYFLYLREDKKLAPSSINIAVCALRFFFLRTLQRDWQVFDLLRVHKPQRLPIVLSTGEVRAVLQAVRHPVRRMALTSIYAFGLRLNEALPLASEDIDSQRLMVRLRNAKGAKDRGVPLPRPLLARLRRYWKLDRPQSTSNYLFVPANGLAPMHATTLQKTFTAACRDIALKKHATTPWGKRWVAFAKPVVQGSDKVLEYLGRHVHRTALSNRAIVATDDRTVTFRYRDSRTHERKTMTLPADEFLRRFLQHVLVKGFHRVRTYGLLHPEHRHALRRLQLLLAPPKATEPATRQRSLPEAKPLLTCPHCRKPTLRLVRHLSAAECIAQDNAARNAVPALARAPPPARDPVAAVVQP